MRHLSRVSRLPVPSAVMLALASILVSVAPIGAQAALASGSAGGEPQVAQPGYGLKVAPSCRYEATSVGRFGWTEARLRRIRVDPPSMWAMRTKQTVGWRFVVQRSIDDAPWTVTYRSPIQRSTAYSDRPASFTKMAVDVKLPAINDKTRVEYRVVIKAFWYRADGSIEYKIKDLIDEYDFYVDGEYEFRDAGSCRGEIRQFFN